MSGEGGFLVEDFLDAISAQLDRTQDALAAKAKVRPMTFALRNFAVDLQVFVSMDTDGNVRLRSAEPGETGSSTLKLDFTTITRPMIEENTVSLAMAQAPTLQEVGLDPSEQKGLERIGVRTVAQLQALRASGAGVDGIARLTDGIVPADRLRTALRLGRPQVFHVAPVQGNGSPAAPPASAPSAPPAAPPAQQPAQPQVVHVPPGANRLELLGRNLLGGGTPPVIRLGGNLLTQQAQEDDRLVVQLPHGHTGGALEVDLGDGEPLSFDLRLAPHPTSNGGADPWTPEEPR